MDGGREGEVRGAACGALGGGWLAGIGGAERGGRLSPAPAATPSGSIFLNFEVHFSAFDAKKNVVFLEIIKKIIDFSKILSGVPP